MHVMHVHVLVTTAFVDCSMFVYWLISKGQKHLRVRSVNTLHTTKPIVTGISPRGTLQWSVGA